MNNRTKLSPRKVFWEKGACSHAMFYLLNHEFGNNRPDAETASDLLAGGIAQKGHQCGMLWGATLAAGAESYRRFGATDAAISTAISAAQKLIVSFEKRTHAVNCREIAKVDWESRRQFAIYMIKTIFQGFVYSPCFNLIVKWTPDAINAVQDGLNHLPSSKTTCKSCASEVVKQAGGTDEEAMMVAGFAGGIGLSGKTCGALAAAIWYRMLLWVRSNEGKKPSLFANPDSKRILRTFYIQTDSEVLCSKISGMTFADAPAHSDYMMNGGCSNLIRALQEAILVPE